MPYLIDGYNLYHAMCRFAPEWSHITPKTMCELIDQDMHLLRDHAVVVFDGTDRGKPHGGLNFSHLKVLFCGHESDADTLLDKLIRKNSAPRRLQVVSSDNSVCKAARRRRAKTLKSPQYLENLLRRMNQPLPPPQEPKEKRQGLEPDQVAEWMQLFGFDPDPDPDPNPDPNLPDDQVDRTRF